MRILSLVMFHLRLASSLPVLWYLVSSGVMCSLSPMLVPSQPGWMQWRNWRGSLLPTVVLEQVRGAPPLTACSVEPPAQVVRASFAMLGKAEAHYSSSCLWLCCYAGPVARLPVRGQNRPVTVSLPVLLKAAQLFNCKVTSLSPAGLCAVLSSGLLSYIPESAHLSRMPHASTPALTHSHAQDTLRRLPDLERGLTRALHRTASPSEFVQTLLALGKVRRQGRK
jgi:hypothetical protein